MGWLDSVNQLNVHEFEQTPGNSGGQRRLMLQSMRSQRIRHDLANEQKQIRERYITRLYIVTKIFNLYAEYIIQNAGLDESQARIKIAGRNINSLRYTLHIS